MAQLSKQYIVSDASGKQFKTGVHHIKDDVRLKALLDG